MPWFSLGMLKKKLCVKKRRREKEEIQKKSELNVSVVVSRLMLLRFSPRRLSKNEERKLKGEGEEGKGKKRKEGKRKFIFSVKIKSWAFVEDR